MLRTRVVWTGVAGTPWYSTFYWVGDGPSIANAAQLSTAGWLASIVGLVVTDVQGQVDSEVIEINAATGDIVTAYDVAGSTSVGTNIGEPLPFQVQVLTNLGTTEFRFGRRVKGRSFLGGLAETNNSDGVGPDEVIREVIQDVYVDHLLGSTAGFGVWSRPTTARPVGEITSVTSATTSPVWSTLRSRRGA
uniref:Uncharacterized protein n=1 Tax=uncultured prokaryote TaxID=198431 RepID=A0A0H5QM20_9ZZZZ|nr:hypothetical protein [uncultured prokaryote]